ncbi:MAG: metalloregulator ArsR/SmtB family transcription factor [Nitrospirae bacterium]|nr:metalloregulator ArsR/SmtB family transcription factor [Nitrospirota bacterium]
MEELLKIFKALSDETRMRILKLLEHGELCVCDIVAALDMIQPKVSFHLNVLREAGLIKDRKRGKWINYSLDESDMFRRFLILSIIERISENLIQKDRIRLEKFLKNKKTKTNITANKKEKICCENGLAVEEVQRG